MALTNHVEVSTMTVSRVLRVNLHASVVSNKTENRVLMWNEWQLTRKQKQQKVRKTYLMALIITNDCYFKSVCQEIESVSETALHSNPFNVHY